MLDFSFRRRKAGKFEVYKGSNEDFYWRLKSANGEIIAISEGYKTQAGAKNGIKAVKEIASISKIEYLE